MYFLFLFLLFPSALVARVTGLLKKETLRAMQKQKKKTHTHTQRVKNNNDSSPNLWNNFAASSK